MSVTMPEVLVTGATGNVGREVVDQLLDAGVKVAAVTREPAGAALPGDAVVVAADPSRPAALAASLAGVEALLLSPRAVGDDRGAAAELLRAAADHGVRRVVVLSAVTVAYGGGYRRFAEGYRAIEHVAASSGLAWTFLRSSQYATNSLVWAPQIRAAGVVRGAYGDAAVSPIHPRDIAAVAVQAVLGPGHAGRAYPLTGRELLSQRDQVRIIGEAAGVDAAWEEIPPEEARAGMIARGLPEEVPDRMLGYLATCLAQPGPSTDTVSELLGRPALTFAEWAAENAAAFRA